MPSPLLFLSLHPHLYSLTTPALSFAFFVSERHIIDALGRGESLVHLHLPIQLFSASIFLSGVKQQDTLASRVDTKISIQSSASPLSSLRLSPAVMKGLGNMLMGIAAATWFAASALAQLDPIVIKVRSFDWLSSFYL